MEKVLIVLMIPALLAYIAGLSFLGLAAFGSSDQTRIKSLARGVLLMMFWVSHKLYVMSYLANHQ